MIESTPDGQDTSAVRRETSRSDWPFLDETPVGRIDLQRGLVDDDPFFRLLGVTLREAARDTATLALTFRTELAQPTGILHGGLHGVLIDSAMAQALITTLRPSFSVVTVHLDTKYFAPVRSGLVVASANVVRKGKRIAHAEACVMDETGLAVAQGWGVFAIVSF